MVNKPKKALNVANIRNQTINRIQFEGEFYDAYGNPQNRGVWFIWGGSGSGKSAHAMQIAKEMSQRLKYKVFHNLCEELPNDSEYIERVENLEMSDIDGFYFAQSYNYEQCCKYLDKPSVKIIIIDSATYFFKDKAQYMEFAKKYKGKKLIIITGHAEGVRPRSELEKDIMYDAKMKIFANGYLASCKGRTIGPNGGMFTIWKEGFEKLRGQQKQQK